jgi:hypothetical protein
MCQVCSPVEESDAHVTDAPGDFLGIVVDDRPLIVRPALHLPRKPATSCGANADHEEE